MTALDPVFTVGEQIGETLRTHTGCSIREGRDRAIEALTQVGIPLPERRINEYPHQLSGGMRQRVMIAIALACEPDLLIADEPTTALDVTIQAQILELLLKLVQARGTSLIFISHNLGVVAQCCERMVTMYAGQVVETGTIDDVLEHPLHPYTSGLLALDAVAGKTRHPAGVDRWPRAAAGRDAGGLSLPAALHACDRQMPGAAGAAAQRLRPRRSLHPPSRTGAAGGGRMSCCRGQHHQRPGRQGPFQDRHSRRDREGRRRRVVRHRRGRYARHHRRIRLGKVDAGAGAGRAAGPDGRNHPAGRPQPLRASAGRAAQAAPEIPDHLPGPARSAQSARKGSRQRARTAGDLRRRRLEAGAQRHGDRHVAARRHQFGAGAALSARTVGRPEAAHQHRPRADPAAEAAGRRRGDRRARRLDPGRHPEPLHGPEGRVQSHLRLHHPRSRGRHACQPRHRRDVSRRHRRVCAGRGAARPQCPSLHARPAFGRTGGAAEAAADRSAHRAAGRNPEPGFAAVRLPLPHALSDRPAGLRARRCRSSASSQTSHYVACHFPLDRKEAMP